ncbi:rano class II histocompatibility antigen, D-1 beta chain-like [Colossoma macropomum]|uniref:rano class II histocompatibility antigen, D-1 beta chain-like n=1 Tax=Colossoma macropomum TaxID=42526 RepID=UPI001865002D|nr:rano class II histocompatibility antigen, D-1 beta chain-like [Colossoma macropomum]
MIHTASVLALLGLSFLLSDVAGDKHSLYYLYSIQSKSSTDRVSEFSAVTLLNDRQIDSYSSTDRVRTPKQDWVKEMKENEWKEGTEKLKNDGQQLNKILNIQMETFRHAESAPPDVHVFAKKSTTDSGMLTLTCLATGFYPKSVDISVRKFSTSLPEHLLRSSGVRPNGDGTYQLRKSVEIQEDDTADYNCYVTHSSFDTPVIKQWDKKCNNCQSSGSGTVGAVAGGVVGLLLSSGGIIFTLIKKGIISIPGIPGAAGAAGSAGSAGAAGAAGAAKTAATALQALPNGATEPLLTADRKASGGSDASSDSGQGTGSTNSSNENIVNGSSDSGNGHVHVVVMNGAPATA